MRFEHHTIQELALSIRDSKANPVNYDREAREVLRRACRIRLGEQPMETYLARYDHAVDINLARQAWGEVLNFVKAANYTSGVWK